MMDRLEIILEKLKGKSNREIARVSGNNRKTVAKYWNEYLENDIKLMNKANVKEIQEKMTEAPKYNSENRKRKKFTEDIADELDKILLSEKEKDKILGIHKQQLTKKQIHAQLIDMGFDIGISTITTEINRIRQKANECFIRQTVQLWRSIRV